MDEFKLACPALPPVIPPDLAERSWIVEEGRWLLAVVVFDRYESSLLGFGWELYLKRFNSKRSSWGTRPIFNCPCTFPTVSTILYQPEICCRPDSNGLRSIETKPSTLSPDFSRRSECDFRSSLHKARTWNRFDICIDLVPHFENERLLLIEEMFDSEFHCLLMVPHWFACCFQHLRATEMIGISSGIRDVWIRWHVCISIDDENEKTVNDRSLNNLTRVWNRW